MFLTSVVTLVIGAISCVSAAPAAASELMEMTPRDSCYGGGLYSSYWADYRNTRYSCGAGGHYDLSWGNGGNVVAGRGWKPASPRAVTYSGSWQCNGNCYLSVYGWTTYPLVEYYIVENYGNYNPSAGAQRRGQVTADGSIYDIYISTQHNQPSILGTNTFHQYWSIRRNKRVGGTVSTGVHFNAWRSLGMPLGTYDYMIVATEGFRSSGSASITVS
ncbi:NAD(P)H-dependent D-xylose reductase (XR) [Claviceps capensis]|nr:NAD(P)H-dependent D-xylose reductase (XR) [Claviceps capensis]